MRTNYKYVVVVMQWLKWHRVAGGLKAKRQRRQDRDAVGVEGGREWVPIRLGGLGSVVSSPSGVRAEPRPKMNLVHFICHRTLLVKAKSNLFIHNYSGTNKQINKNYLKFTHQAP